MYAGGEGGEEDVDIDDDLAPTNFAPVVIDKDGGGDAGPLPAKSTDDSSSDSESGSSGSSGNLPNFPHQLLACLSSRLVYLKLEVCFDLTP